MLENKRAVLFDLDGTLADSMWMWRQIDIDYLARFGKEFTPDLQRAIDGKSIHETAVYMKARYEIPDTIEKMQADWNDMARQFYRERVPLKDGALELLRGLKERGIRIGIGTSNSRELTEEVLVTHGVMEYFDGILTSAEVKRGKPKPDIYLALAERLHVSPADCLVFEDVVQGIEAGRNAGMQVCAVEDPYSAWSRDQKRALADYYVESFREVTAEWETPR
ncbi:MAG: HAD family phosphatase [Lachnospiraceae bacterium]|nr:HAD family phosphatase [Lachnospiraceae bacterium]